MEGQDPVVEELAAGIRAGNRRALARGVTLVESTRSDDRARAAALLEALRPLGREALRIGLSGTPGVGKSTFIEAFGTMLTGQGQKVAVLAVDPSSSRTGGSILGDKTRMPRLARDPHAFVRPSPSRAELGGVARRTREAIALCEAAGFDVVIVETVGVGQSETAVAEMTDIFTLLIAPAGGDELQGVKRGIMELAELILVNKADGPLRATAMRTAAEYAAALRLFRHRPEDPEGWPRVLTVSAVEGSGLEEVRAAIDELVAWRRASGWWARRRARQRVAWFEEEVREALLARLREDPEIRAEVERLARSVAYGILSPPCAAEQVVRQMS